MPYLTKLQARGAASSGRLLESASTTLRRTARVPLSERFDVFLSHCYEDAELIVGVMRLLARRGLSVYVDWVEDNEIICTEIDAETAAILRRRMTNSRFLLFVTTTERSVSRWQPWEFGYFDGHKPGRIGVLPLVDRSDEPFAARGYLGLYPCVEVDSVCGARPRFIVCFGPSIRQDLMQIVGHP
jgi:hypothetical protein